MFNKVPIDQMVANALQNSDSATISNQLNLLDY